MAGHILLAEDDKALSALMQDFFRAAGVQVTPAYDGGQALALAQERTFDLLVLDVMMPHLNGLEVCAAVRRESDVPVIFVTALGQEGDTLAGFRAGADDYVTKPFNPLELVARVKAQLRRSTRYNAGAAPESHVIDFSGLEINKDTHECRLYDQPVDLTPTEFSLLWMLCQNRGKVLSAEELFEGVWGEKYLDSNNTVMVHIRRLREKLHEPARNPKFIKTVWGVGYKIEG